MGVLPADGGGIDQMLVDGLRVSVIPVFKGYVRSFCSIGRRIQARLNAERCLTRMCAVPATCLLTGPRIRAACDRAISRDSLSSTLESIGFVKSGCGSSFGGWRMRGFYRLHRTRPGGRWYFPWMGVTTCSFTDHSRRTHRYGLPCRWCCPGWSATTVS